jgi:hypothetical protein
MPSPIAIMADRKKTSDVCACTGFVRRAIFSLSHHQIQLNLRGVHTRRNLPAAITLARSKSHVSVLGDADIRLA